jgi:ligand-binding sensor domain-containing protein/serine phosphatase RsbU (regulator of sigma subunit)
MKKLLNLFFLLLSFLFIQEANSQRNALKFERLSISQGLSQSSVYSILQDNVGFLWFGTAEGLNRYDGNKFTIYTYNALDSTSISSSWITCIFEDKFHNLWLGTSNGGLNRYDRNSEKFQYYKNNKSNQNTLSNNDVNAIQEDFDGLLWIGTNNGLNKFDPIKGSFTRFYNDTSKMLSLPNNTINTLLVTKNNELWIGTNKGLVRYKKDYKGNEVFLTYRSNLKDTNSLSNEIIYSIKEDFENPNNYLWIATSNGLNKFDKQNEHVQRYLVDPDKPSSICNNNIKTLTFNASGDLWIGTDDGLCRLTYSNKPKGKFISYKYSPTDAFSLSKNIILNVFVDREDIVWVGTKGGGINKTLKTKFIHYKNDPNNPNSLKNNSVWSIFKDHSGFIWAGTENGLDRMNPQTEQFVHYTLAPPGANIGEYIVYAIHEDKNNTIWIGTGKSGLFKLNPESGKLINYRNIADNPNSLSNNYIKSITSDKAGFIWLATRGGGLNRFDPKTETFMRFTYNPENTNGINHNRLNSILVDKEGFIWIGTSGGGLNKFDPEKKIFSVYKYDPKDSTSLSDIYVMSMCEDKKGNLWVGTYDGGLNYFDRQTGISSHYTKDDGLPNNVIYGIQLDENENIWGSTNKGLFMLNKATQQIQTFDINSGLQDNEFNSGSCYKSSDGEIFFGGLNGFNSFFPSDIKYNTIPPKIVITDFRIFNKSVIISKNSPLNRSITQTEELTLSYKDYVFSFEFAALSFESQHKNQYLYMLEGFDNEWISTNDKSRIATYTNLSGGEYKFHIKGSNNDKVWNEEGETIKIIIKPPFWQTWWFRIAVFLLINISAVSFYLIRINTVKRQKQVLERLVNERTAEIVKQKNQIEKAYQNVEMLSTIGKEITANLIVVKIIETVFSSLNTIFDVSIFAIGIYNSERNEIFFSGTKEKGKTLPSYSFSLSEENRLAVVCFNQKLDILISDFETEYSKYIQAIAPPKAGENPLSIIYLPMSVKDKIIGVISVQSFNKNAYTDYHLNILKNISVYTAIALDNASAYVKIEKQAFELKEYNLELQEQREEIRQQSEELIAQSEVLLVTNQALEKEKEYTMGSIRYAKTIQNAILPEKSNIDQLFESFILFRPKDIVSGDFYWFSRVETTENKKITFLAVVDCTGHGVPGAFMSMIGSRLFNEIVNERKIDQPSEILRVLDHEIQIALHQSESDNDDGMDVCLCRINDKIGLEYNIKFSGAKRPLFYYSQTDKKLNKLTGTHRGIGGVKYKKDRINFVDQVLNLKKDDLLFLTSDGIIDQNAPDRRRFGTPKVIEILTNNIDKPINDQKFLLESELNDFMKTEKQRDDITMIGIRLI